MSKLLKVTVNYHVEDARSMDHGVGSFHCTKDSFTDWLSLLAGSAYGRPFILVNSDRGVKHYVPVDTVQAYKLQEVEVIDAPHDDLVPQGVSDHELG